MQLLNRTGVQAKCVSAQKQSRSVVVVRASLSPVESTSRRATLAAIVSGAALLSSAAPSLAAFGDSANVFGGITNKSGYIPYVGDDFAVLLPSKWNPSKERDFLGVQLRYEDNGAAANNLIVLKNPTDKKNISDFGAPENFLNELSYLLGKQSYEGETQSEGGFAPNRVSVAALLDIEQETDKKGKTYYKYEILTRTADGDEGGRHQLIKATVSNGQLYICKIQVGDKRWFKGADKIAKLALASFSVA